MSLQKGVPSGGGDAYRRSGRLGVYDPELVRQIAISLFRAWPYAAYREEARLRADDQLIRARTAWLLGQARAAVQLADDGWRAAMLPPATDAQPCPDPAALEAVQAVERLSRTLSALLAQLNALPTPPNARMVARHRKTAGALVPLATLDEQLVGQAELLRISLEGKPGAWIVASLASITPGLAAIETLLRERGALLSGKPSASARKPR